MLLPILDGAEVRDVVRVDGGLVNTIYRATLEAGEGACSAVAVKVFAAGRAAYETERHLLTRLATSLPVPDLRFADATESRSAHPYLVYRWIDGITLNECRQRGEPDALLTLAAPLGRLLAHIAGTPFADRRVGRVNGGRSRAPRIAADLARADERLRSGMARERLGYALADGLRHRLARSEAILHAVENPRGFAHGDLGGRNVLVNALASGKWTISGVLDWESAITGSPLWDVGSLFRYASRYSPEFRERFAVAYRAAGGELPHDWWRIARLLDATRQVAILSGERELPSVFGECRELIERVVAGRRSSSAWTRERPLSDSDRDERTSI